MKRLSISTVLALLIVSTTARGDGLLFSYDGDILPGDAGSGWIIANACEPDCTRRLEAGHFLLEWGVMGDLVNYSHETAAPPDPPPPTLWIE